MHESWMHHAISQAKKGLGLTSPNPIVGAVIVRNNRIVGEGFHPKAGEPHAERFAIADAQKNLGQQDLTDCSIYVTLEPCSTTGKTPPCTQGIIEANISHVIKVYPG